MTTESTSTETDVQNNQEPDYKAMWEAAQQSITGLENTNRTMKEEKRQLADKVAEFERAKNEAANQAATSSEDVEQVRTLLQGQLSEKDTLISALTGAMVDKEVKATLANAIADAKGNNALLNPLLQGRVKGELKDGEVVIQITGEDGKPMLNKKGEPATVKDLVKSLRENVAYAAAFESNGATGSGATTSNSATTFSPNNPFLKGPTFNITEQHALKLKDPARAKTLMEEAKRQGS